MKSFQTTDYDEKALEFLKVQSKRDPSSFFTTITSMNQLLSRRDRDKLKSRVRNISQKLQREFEDILEPLVREGFLEKAVVCSQSFDMYSSIKKINSVQTYLKIQTVYRMACFKPPKEFRDYLAEKSLDSSML